MICKVWHQFDALNFLEFIMEMSICTNIAKILTHPCIKEQYKDYILISRQDDIYLTSQHIRIWHKAILWWGPCTNQDSIAAGAKTLDTVGIPLLVHFMHQPINLVLLAGKDLG